MKNTFQLVLLLVSTSLCVSCATTFGMTAAAITSATIAVGAAIVTAPFKIIGAMNGDEDRDDDNGQDDSDESD